jgi:hypothetical protein
MRDRLLRLEPQTAGISPAKAGGAARRFGTMIAAALPRDPELSPRDWAVFLLHTATEIEHALLVQYLYSAYSIRLGLAVPSGGDTDIWQHVILEIAQEEMGHLVTLQNVLQVIGGPLNFDREDFPYRSKLYPFPFSLQRLTKNTLAKYVAAEMPEHVDSTVLPDDERDEIWDRATNSSGGIAVNHVGTLYRELQDVVDQLPVADFRTDRGALQATLAEGWGDNDDETPYEIKVVAITGSDAAANKAAVLRALRIIALQGEGVSASDVTGSHFLRFLEIYRAFPDLGFDPSFHVGTDPYVASGGGGSGDPITNPTSQAWARLLNVRYRVLLSMLAHVLDIPPLDSAGAATPRGALIAWVFNEMAYGPACVRQLALKLAQLPRASSPDDTAGAPFALPFSLPLSSRAPERWRLHLDLIDASVELIRSIEDPPTDPLLRSVYEYEMGAGGAAGRRVEVLALQASPF